jgi:DNA invertase Pin-like site-specific DNA recombinase
MGDKFVGLIRVSTKGQGDSGLGLLAGRDDIDRYVESVGGELVTVLEEVGSGKHKKIIDRPVLLKALTLCKRHGAILLFPKVDRLLRSTEVHNDIKLSGVKIRACDNPYADEVIMDILVAFAAHERREIGKRTKKSLKAYVDSGKVSDVQMTRLIIKHVPDVPKGELEAASDKNGRKALVAAHGHKVPREFVEPLAGKLGSRLIGSPLTGADREAGRKVAGANRTRKAVEVYADFLPEMMAWRAGGMTLRAIARTLNDRGDRTRTGAFWRKVQVKRVLDRAGA